MCWLTCKEYVKRSKFGRRPKLKRLKAKSVGEQLDKSKLHVFTKSERIFLSNFECWECVHLIHCGECKRFECGLDCDRPLVSRGNVCQFREGLFDNSEGID